MSKQINDIGKSLQQLLDLSGDYVTKEDIDNLKRWICSEMTKAHPTNPYFGKKAVFLGDSQTEQNYHKGKIYINWVQEILGLSEVKNYGISGTCIAKKNETDNTSMCVRYANMDSDAGLIVVMGGVNDVWFNSQLGQLGDEDPLTFYGAMDVLCKGLHNKYPGKDIVFITPAEQNNTNCTSSNTIGTCVADYAKAMKEVCAKYAIRVFDAHSELGIYPYIASNSSFYTTDGLHYNDAAHEKLGREFCKYLLAGCQMATYEVDEEFAPEDPVLYTVTYAPTGTLQSSVVHFMVACKTSDLAQGDTISFYMEIEDWTGADKTYPEGGGIFASASALSDGSFTLSYSSGLKLDGSISGGRGFLSKTFTMPGPLNSSEYVKIAFAFTNLASGQTASFNIKSISLTVNGEPVDIVHIGGFFENEGCSVVKLTNK